MGETESAFQPSRLTMLKCVQKAAAVRRKYAYMHSLSDGTKYACSGATVSLGDFAT